MSPTVRAAVLLALISLSALLLPVWLAAAAALLLVGAVLADAALARAPARVEREAPELLSRGVPDSLLVRAAVPAGRSALVRQASSPDLEVSPAEGHPPLEARLVARRRGRHGLAPVTIRVRGPLGLAAWQRPAGGRHEVRVFPDLPAARAATAAARRSRLRDPGTRGRGPLGLGTEFESIRDYSPDDDIRQVNWLATARLGRPMSNDFRLEQDRDVLALVDAGRLMAAPIGERTRLDAALDAVAALAAVADDLGDRFGALAFDAEVRASLRPRRSGGVVAVHGLFDLEPSLLESDYLRAFRRVEGSKRALVVVYTDLLEEGAARPLLEAVPVLVRRHALVIASALDPDLESAVRTPPRTALDVYRAAVSLDVLAARRRVTARLRRAGAEVIEAPAGRLGMASVRAYLRAKARARL